MTSQTILPTPYPLGPFVSNETTFTLNAAGEGIGAVFRVPVAGAIDRIGFHMANITTGGTCDVRVETVDSSTGVNTGTLWDTNTNGSLVVANTDDNTWLECTLTSTASVSVGDYVAVVIVAPSGFNGTIRKFTSPIVAGSLPYTIQNSGSWTRNQDRPAITVRWADTRYYPIEGFAVLQITDQNQAISSAITPDEVGLKFTFPFGATMMGAQVWLSGVATSEDFVMKLYDSSDTLVSSETVDAAYFPDGMGYVNFLDNPELTSGETYRLTVLPSTTNAFNLKYATVSDTVYQEQTPGRNLAQWTERTDAGSWTDSGLLIPWLQPVLSGIELGSGGGHSHAYTVI